MAQQVKIAGALFQDVPSISVPDANDVWHAFTDTSADAVAADIASGKTAYAGGVKLVGTNPGGATVEPLSVTVNGTYTAPTGTAYSPVTVNVSAGNSPYTLLDSSEFSVSTTSGSDVSVGTITMGNSLYTASAIIYVKVRDKAGKRKGYFYGTDTFFVNSFAAKNVRQSLISIRPSILYSFDGNGLTKFSPKTGGFSFSNSSSSYGVYASAISGSGDVVINGKYNSNTGTIDGTYIVDVYLLKWPDDISPISSVV